MKMKNDVSFLTDHSLNLYEHQSSYNPNMPLRGLLYFADLYRGIISEEDNPELLGKCSVLREYSVFVATVRKYLRGNDINTGILLAVNECIEKGVLKDFLLKHKAEVIDVLLTEYDEEKVMNALKREAWEDGLEEGRKTGIEVGLDIETAILKVSENFKLPIDEVQKIWEAL